MILMEILTVGLGELPEERIERNRINFAGNIKGKNENSVKKKVRMCVAKWLECYCSDREI